MMPPGFREARCCLSCQRYKAGYHAGRCRLHNHPTDDTNDCDDYVSDDVQTKLEKEDEKNAKCTDREEQNDR